jgi:hypothetical protein
VISGKNIFFIFLLCHYFYNKQTNTREVKMNIKAKSKPGMWIILIAIIGIGAYLYFTPGTQVWGPFSTVGSVNYDTCNTYTLNSNQTNLAGNFLDTLNADDCSCALLSCTSNVTCASNGAGQDCQARDGRTSQFISRVSSDSKNGAKTLELLGRRADACQSKTIPVEPGKTYTLSFWFKHVQGLSPSYCIWRTGSGNLKSDCEPSKSFLSLQGSWNNDTAWHYYQEPFTVPAGTQSMGLFFYAQGQEGEGADSITIKRYSDIRLVEGNIACTGNTNTETSNFFTQTIYKIGDFELKVWMAILAVVLIILLFVFKK